MKKARIGHDWLLPGVGLVLSAAAGAGVASEDPLVALILPLMGILAASCLVVWRPHVAIFIGIATPFSYQLPRHLFLMLAAMALLAVATFRSWATASTDARRGAVLIATFGSSVLLLDAAVIHEGQPAAGAVLAVAYTTAVGVTAAATRITPLLVARCLLALGFLATYSALTSARLTADRTTVILGENANGVGFLIALGLVAGVLLLRNRGLRGPVIGGAAAVTGVFALFATGSRGAVLAASVGVAVIALRRLISGGRVKAVVAVACLAGSVLLAASPVTDAFLDATGREASGAQQNVVDRERSLAFAVQQGVAHPLFGIGLGGLAGGGQQLSAHNVFGGIFAESGAIAALLFTAICALSLLRAREHAPRSLLPLLAAVIISGLSLEWWGQGRTGPVAMLVIGAALGLPRAARGGPSTKEQSRHSRPVGAGGAVG